MSLQSLLVLFSVIITLSTFLFKWKKLLVIILLLESSTAMALAFILSFGSMPGILLILLSFFVSEALIILTALYNSLRVAGSSFSTSLSS